MDNACNFNTKKHIKSDKRSRDFKEDIMKIKRDIMMKNTTGKNRNAKIVQSCKISDNMLNMSDMSNKFIVDQRDKMSKVMDLNEKTYKNVYTFHAYSMGSKILCFNKKEEFISVLKSKYNISRKTKDLLKLKTLSRDTMTKFDKNSTANSIRPCMICYEFSLCLDEDHTKYFYNNCNHIIHEICGKVLWPFHSHEPINQVKKCALCVVLDDYQN